MAALKDRDAAVGEAVPVKVLRRRKEETLAWVPFPPGISDGRNQEPWESVRKQFGFTFAGYPLDFRPECR